MIENPETLHIPAIQINGQVATVKTRKVLFGTKTVFDIVLTTADAQALVLGALKATSRVKITVEPIDAQEKPSGKEFK